MSARHKLNAANAVGAMIVASLIGGSADSWAVFWIALVVLILAGLHAGDIRTSGRDPRR